MNNILIYIYPKIYLDKMDKKIKKLNNNLTLNTFLKGRIIIEIILFIGLLLIPIYGLYLSILITLLFHYLYEDILINSPLIKKDKQMYEDVYYFLKIYSISLDSNYDPYEAFIYTSNIISNTFTKEVKKLKKEKLDYYTFIKKVNMIIPEDININIDSLNKKEVKKEINKLLDILDNNNKIKIQNYINNIPLKVIIISIIFLTLVIFIILEGPKYLT